MVRREELPTPRRTRTTSTPTSMPRTPHSRVSTRSAPTRRTSDIGDGAKGRAANNDYGLTNSLFLSRIEDISSGHPAIGDSVLPLNNLMIPGPRRGEVGYSSWTTPDGRPNWMWDHEFQHAMNKS